jgi:hypothetical protein
MMLTLEALQTLKGRGWPAIPGRLSPTLGSWSVSMACCMWRNAIQARTSPFCRCRGLSGDLSKWSSGNDHSFYPSRLPGEPLETHEHGVTSIRKWLVANVEGYEDRDVPPLTVEVEGCQFRQATGACVIRPDSDTGFIRSLRAGGRPSRGLVSVSPLPQQPIHCL